MGFFKVWGNANVHMSIFLYMLFVEYIGLHGWIIGLGLDFLFSFSFLRKWVRFGLRGLLQLTRLDWVRLGWIVSDLAQPICDGRKKASP